VARAKEREEREEREGLAAEARVSGRLGFNGGSLCR
jgi:hypothetical protein